MKTIEILFGTVQSGGTHGSRVVVCDEWRWRARSHTDGELVAQFDASSVLGVVDLSAVVRTSDSARETKRGREAGSRCDMAADSVVDEDETDETDEDDETEDDETEDEREGRGYPGETTEANEDQQAAAPGDDLGDEAGARTVAPTGAFRPGVGGDPWPTKGRRPGPRPAPLQRPRG